MTKLINLTKPHWKYYFDNKLVDKYLVIPAFKHSIMLKVWDHHIEKVLLPLTFYHQYDYANLPTQPSIIKW